LIRSIAKFLIAVPGHPELKYSFISTLILCFIIQSKGQTVSYSLDHWVYRFLERLEAENLFNSPALRSKPISRSAIEEILTSIHKNIRENPALLTEADRRLLRQLEHDLFRKNRFFTFEPVLRETIIADHGTNTAETSPISETTIGVNLYGMLGKNFAYYLDARNSLVRGTGAGLDRFDIAAPSPARLYGPNIFRDRLIGYIIYEKSWLRAELGRNEFRWGPGYLGDLALSNNIPTTEMVRLSARLGRFRFTSAHAFLFDTMGPKFLAAHKLNIELIPGMYFGAGETVLYGNRDVELAYLNPLMPYHIAEHHLGDRDNNNMCFDFTLTRLPSTTIYAEYFIDDMTCTENLLTYFGNKFAFLAGILWTDVVNLPDLDLRLEYTRVEPYVYTHWDTINIYTYKNHLIGYQLGPNSDNAFLQLSYRIKGDIEIDVFSLRQRKGDGAPDTNTKPETGTHKYFLKGIVEDRRLYGLTVRDQLRKDLFVALSYVYSNTENMDRIAGSRSHDHMARLEIYYKY
jgi:hypothetical protein